MLQIESQNRNVQNSFQLLFKMHILAAIIETQVKVLLKITVTTKYKNLFFIISVKFE